MSLCMRTFFSDLCKLKQTGIMRVYQNEFERILSKAKTLRDKQEAECFISGLKDYVRIEVKSRPASIELFKAYENKPWLP